MEVTVLGSGSSGNGYRIEQGGESLLLEAGLPLKVIRERMGYQLSAVAGCLVSHSHGDHAQSAAELVKGAIDVYCSADTIQEVGLSGHRVHAVTALTPFSVGGFRVLPFPLEHDVTNYGYLIAKGGEKAVYITDTYYVRYRFNHLTHLLVEANYAEDILRTNTHRGAVSATLARRIRHSHLSLETLKGFLRANDLSTVHEIWLLHLSNANADADRFQREVAALTGKPVYVA